MSATTTPVFITSGDRKQAHKICYFTHDPRLNQSSYTKMLSLRIINGKGYKKPFIEDILINFDGKIFSNKQGDYSGDGNVYISTFKYNNEIVTMPDGSEAEKIDIVVYLFSENYSDNWELYLIDEQNIGAITSQEITVPNNQPLESIVPQTPVHILVANSKTGFGCVGELRVNNQPVLTGSLMGINVKFPPAGLMAAKGGRQNDDTEAIQACYDALKKGETLIIPPGEYYIRNLVFDKSEVHIKCNGTLWQLTKDAENNDVLGAAVTLGKPDNLLPTDFVDANLKVRKEKRDWSKDTTGVRLLNMWHGVFTLDISDFTENLVLEGNKPPQVEKGGGCALNTIHPKYIFNGQKNIAFKALRGGYTNENKFFGGHLGWDVDIQDYDRYQIYIPNPNPYDSGRAINNNVFLSPCIEAYDGGTIIFCEGYQNSFYSPRFEIIYKKRTQTQGYQGKIISFGANSKNNRVFYPFCYFPGEESPEPSNTDKYYCNDGSENNHIYGINEMQLTGARINNINSIKLSGAFPDGSPIVGLIEASPKVTRKNNIVAYNNGRKLWVGKKIVENNGVTSEEITSSINALGNAVFASVESPNVAKAQTVEARTSGPDESITMVKGWYRIARNVPESARGRIIGNFKLKAYESGKAHSVSILMASCVLGYNPEIIQLSHSYYPGMPGITKARIVYKPVGNSNEEFLYLEVYQSINNAIDFSVELIQNDSWELITPLLVGDDPGQDFNYKEINLGHGIVSSNGFSGPGLVPLRINNNKLEYNTGTTASPSWVALAND